MVAIAPVILLHYAIVNDIRNFRYAFRDITGIANDIRVEVRIKNLVKEK